MLVGCPLPRLTTGRINFLRGLNRHKTVPFSDLQLVQTSLQIKSWHHLKNTINAAPHTPEMCFVATAFALQQTLDVVCNNFPTTFHLKNELVTKRRLRQH